MGKGLGKKKKRPKVETPLGIKALITYSYIMAALHLILGFFVPTNLVFGVVVEGMSATFYNIIFVSLLVLMIYGFHKRESWSFYLAMFLYSFAIVNSIVSIVKIGETTLSLISNIIVVALLFTIILNLLTAWYVFERRNYFLKKSVEKFNILDKVFVSVLNLFYFFSLLMIIALGFEVYKSATFIIDEVAEDISRQGLSDSLDICMEKRGDYQDLCVIAAIASHKREVGVKNLCQDINSAFYKFTCYQVVL